MYPDKYFIGLALAQAKLAKKKGCAPIGAIVVLKNKVISRAYNNKNKLKDPTAHAEILAIRKAAKKIGPNLDNCILFTTLQPCLMCLSAAYWAHIKKIIYGCGREADLKYFVTKKDLTNVVAKDLILRKMTVKGGVSRYECREIIK